MEIIDFNNFQTPENKNRTSDPKTKAIFPIMGIHKPFILKPEMRNGIRFIVLESFRFVSKMLAGIGIAEFVS